MMKIDDQGTLFFNGRKLNKKSNMIEGKFVAQPSGYKQNIHSYHAKTVTEN